MAHQLPPAQPLDGLDDPRNYLDRELGALAFQRRVFEEAQDPRNPLLERLKFIAIIGSNLDEFFMVRVGGLSVPDAELRTWTSRLRICLLPSSWSPSARPPSSSWATSTISSAARSARAEPGRHPPV